MSGRLCPSCQTLRPLHESFCEGTIDGAPCNWDLTLVGIGEPVAAPAPPVRRCPQGHPVAPDDLVCLECGADPIADAPECTPDPTQEVIHGWRLLRPLDDGQRYPAEHETDGRRATVVLYAPGAQPDPAVYEVLRRTDVDHVPALYDTGTWNDRAYEAWEEIATGTLADVPLRAVTEELWKALRAFAECGMRHRDLRPDNVLVRTREPLDLVITGFGSARLSDLDLDIESPLESTRYMAPEAIMGGVSPASDWWSLGMILLELATRGKCFDGLSESLFLIHVMTNEVTIPADLPEDVQHLLKGLLIRDRRKRWKWTEVRAWLDGAPPPLPDSADAPTEATTTRALRLGGQTFRHPRAFALEAARAANWDEASRLLGIGQIATWAQTAGLDLRAISGLRTLTQRVEIAEDLRLAIALKLLNPVLPLIVRESIVTPGWLLEHPDLGWDLVTGPVPSLLTELGMDDEDWLLRLARRAVSIREKAERLDIALDDESLRIHALCASRARLAAVWEERRRLMPDSEHPGLAALLDHPQPTDEDLVILNSANASQFRASGEVLRDALALGSTLGIDVAGAAPLASAPRREVYAALDDRLESFARCGVDRLDGWADEYRLERRIPLERAVVLLAVSPDQWRKPPHQEQVTRLLGFFEKKVAGAILRGPLVRMTIGRTTPRLDLTELAADPAEAQTLLERIVARTDRVAQVDPLAFTRNPTVEPRLRSLVTRTTVFARDTGINGLYLGFPFLLKRDRPGGVRPRLAPVLLWPLKVRAEVGARGRVTLAFDRDRDDVRLNPAFEGMLGLDEADRWRQAAKALLQRPALRVPDVIDALGVLAPPTTRDLGPLPDRAADLPTDTSALHCAAVVFHVEFLGQAIVEDLRALRTVPPAGSALEPMLRIADPPATSPDHEPSPFLVSDSDPSQEEAIGRAWSPPGLLVQGPPGTGKSQTIVNLVADAIGRGKALLVVCQKLPALEVVRKRLVAEGLGQRLVMVTNVNRDRRAVLQDVRTQLESLQAPPPTRRAEIAERIRRLEGELDAHHQALYIPDSVTGKNYREILGELLEAESTAPTPDLPNLSHRLATLPPSEVARIEDDCGALALDWLPAHFEGSALAALAPFPSDDGTVHEFQQRFIALAKAEQERSAIPPGPHDVHDDLALSTWLRQHRARFLALAPTALPSLARLAPLFLNGSGQGWIDVVEGLRQRTRALPDADLTLVLPLPDPELGAWIQRLDAATRNGSFWARANPARWVARWQMGKTMAERGRGADDASLLAALAAATVERDLRPLRRALHSATRDLLGAARDDLLSMDASRLALCADSLLAGLREAQALAGDLATCPLPDAVMHGMRAGALAPTFDALDAAVARCRARNASLAALTRLHTWMSAEWRADVEARIRANQPTPTEPIVHAWSTIAAYQRFRARAAGVPRAVLDAFAALADGRAFLAQVAPDAIPMIVKTTIRRHARLGWKNRMEAGNAVLMSSRHEIEARVTHLAEAEKDLRALNRQFLATHIDRTRVAPAARWEDITRLQGPRAIRLREFFDRGSDLGLLALRPVWLMIPEVASQLLPRTRAQFDMVVYDEASQMPVELALPTLYRARVALVSGDEKQMPPTAFFASRIESDEEPDLDDAAAPDDVLEEAWNRREIKDCPDLLHLAMAALPHATLQVHYRSASRPLITFSNAAFYNDSLSVPACHPDEELQRLRPIRVVEAGGVYREQTNEIEASLVVDELAAIWARPGARPTTGIVTFNRKQADLTEQMLEDRAEEDAAFRQIYTEELDRLDDGEDMGIFVKNVENVQGDERDVIIFSTTFGRGPHGVFRRNFGVLGQKGGERRLNVAVTRARSEIVLVTSMPVGDVSDFLGTRRPPAGPRDYLQAYLEYARRMSEGDLEAARQLVRRFTPAHPEGHRAGSRNDGLARSVEQAIRDLGYAPVPLGDDPTLGVTYAVVHPRTGLYGIGIECETPDHPLLRTARAREVWRRNVLARAYPALHRIAAREWYHDGRREREALAEALRRALT